MGQTHRPVSEVRKGDDGVSGNSKHRAQNTQWIAQLLHSLAENDEIESTVGVVGEALIQVTLVYRDAAGDRSLHFVPVDLDASRINAFMVAQPGKQFAFAAAEIQYAGPGLDNFGDHGVVAAGKQFWTSGLRWGSTYPVASLRAPHGLCRTTWGKRDIAKDTIKEARDNLALLFGFDEE